MVVKCVTFCLMAIAFVAIFGRLRVRKLRGRADKLSTRKGKKCGRYRIGRGPCECGRA